MMSAERYVKSAVENVELKLSKSNCRLPSRLNELDIMYCDIQNTYITALCRERIWTFAGPEFG